MRPFLLYLTFLLAAADNVEDYCYTNNVCVNDFDCYQTILGDVPIAYMGYCCSGRCVAEYPLGFRGANCSAGLSCAGGCSGDNTCQNGVCTGQLHPGCSCSSNAACASGICINGTCLENGLQTGQSCVSPAQCVTENCLNGYCTGSGLTVGFYCRGNDECQLQNCNSSNLCDWKKLGQECDTPGECAAGLYCWKVGTNPGNCTTPVAVGDECLADSWCVASAYCSNTSICTARVALGASCSPTVECVAGAVCNLGHCIAQGALGVNAPCDNGWACGPNLDCSQFSANATVDGMKCVRYNSVPAGGYCTDVSVCMAYAECDNYQCTASYLNMACNVNTTNPTDDGCGDELVCSCGNKCVEEEDPLDFCPDVLSAFFTTSHPTFQNMNAEQQKEYARFLCCGFCDNSASLAVDSSSSGYWIDCSTLKITSAPQCTTTKGGVQIFQNCDKFNEDSGNSGNAATSNSRASFVVLASLSFVALLF